MLFKNACGCSISRPSLGWWGCGGVVGDLAGSDLMGDLTIPEEDQGGLPVWSVMGIQKDRVSLSTHTHTGVAPASRGREEFRGSRGGATGRVGGDEHISCTCG